MQSLDCYTMETPPSDNIEAANASKLEASSSVSSFGADDADNAMEEEASYSFSALPPRPPRDRHALARSSAPGPLLAYLREQQEDTFSDERVASLYPPSRSFEVANGQRLMKSTSATHMQLHHASMHGASVSGSGGVSDGGLLYVSAARQEETYPQDADGLLLQTSSSGPPPGSQPQQPPPGAGPAPSGGSLCLPPMTSTGSGTGTQQQQQQGAAGPGPQPHHAHHPPVAAPLRQQGGGTWDDSSALPSFMSYLAAEARPMEKQPTADIVWGQTERDRVYNFLLHVPYQLERLLSFGFLLLMDSFLAVFTLLPYRCAVALAQVAYGMARRPPIPASSSSAAAAAAFSATPGSSTYSSVAAGHSPRALSGSVSGAVTPGALAGAAAAAGGHFGPQQPPAAPPARRLLSGSQVFDLVCLLLLCTAAAVLRAVRPGAIYYWLKDITSEFLKMSVLHTAFDMSDKILSNFGVDVLEALSGTCTQWVARKKRLSHLLVDAGVAWVILVLHALTLMCQALILAVALNSSRNGIVALLIANNFVEIKSTVFKKWDTTRIWGLVCADMVERFNLGVVLAFVVVEEMDSASSWAPPPAYLRVCALMAAAELVIDVVKHAVLGKFNDIRPGIYREFHEELCGKALSAQSHSAPKLLKFHHLAPAALAARIGLTLFWLRVDQSSQVQWRLAVLAVLYAGLFGVKMLFGYVIKIVARKYGDYYSAKYATKHTTRNQAARTAMGAAGSISAAAPTAAALAAALTTAGAASGGAPWGPAGAAGDTPGGQPSTAVTPTVASAAAAAGKKYGKDE